ncbi:MAG: hypothetical protein GX644_19780 [Limnobacter sp.]|nr:hypothetical protein [Limnobacter sp.]
MSNLTISVDEEVLRRARIRALQQGSSVNAILRELLEAYAGVGPAQSDAVAELIRLSKDSTARRGNAAWTRDDLHERS